VTMSRPSSGSWTLRRASKMAPSVRAGIGGLTSTDHGWDIDGTRVDIVIVL
jgi:hypothetical protein